MDNLKIIDYIDQFVGNANKIDLYKYLIDLQWIADPNHLKDIETYYLGLLPAPYILMVDIYGSVFMYEYGKGYRTKLADNLSTLKKNQLELVKLSKHHIYYLWGRLESIERYGGFK